MQAEVTEGGVGVPASIITGWFQQVYEPVYSGQEDDGE